MDGQLGGIPAQRGPGDGKPHPALAGERDLPAALRTVVDRRGAVQQIADLPVGVVHQRQRGRSVQGRAVGLGIQLHRQRGRALAGAIRAQVQRGSRPRPVQTAHGPPSVVHADGPAHHVPLGQDGGEGEIQAVQHLSARTGKAVLAGDGRAVLRHGDGVEAQGRGGCSAVEPVLQLRLHLLIGDVGRPLVVQDDAPPLGAAVHGIQIPSIYLHAVVLLLIHPDIPVLAGPRVDVTLEGAVILRTPDGVDQRVGVIDEGGRVVNVLVIGRGAEGVSHLAVGGDGEGGHHMVFIGAVVQRRHIHEGVATLYHQCLGGDTHIAFQIAVIPGDDAAHQTTGPNAGGLIIAGVVGVQLPDGDRAAGIAFVQRGPAHTGDAAHTQVVPGGVVAGVQLNVRHGGAAGDVHVGRAYQTAHAAAAPAGGVLPDVPDGIAGHGAVGKGRAGGSRTGKAHQTAHGVPARAVLVIDDLAAPVGIHDDVLQVRADGIAEQAHALGGGFDLNVLDGVRAAVVVRAEEGYVGVGRAAVVVPIHHVADGGEQVIGVVIFRRRVQIVALYPVAPGLIAEPVLARVY